MRTATTQLHHTYKKDRCCNPFAFRFRPFQRRMGGRRTLLLPCFALLWSKVPSTRSSDDCCLCGETCATVSPSSGDTFLVVEEGGSGTCSQLEWYLISHAREGDAQCSLYQDMFSNVCCSLKSEASPLVHSHRKMQWDGGQPYIAGTHTWDNQQEPSVSSSYQSWNTMMIQQLPVQSIPAVTTRPSKPAPVVTNNAVLQQTGVQVIQTSASHANQPPIVNSWGNANQLSDFDHCMVYRRDDSVSAKYCSICAQPTNYARAVVVNNIIGGGNVNFVSSCGELNTAFKCSGIRLDHELCNVAVYGYANQCGCRQFDNNSEEFFGYDTGNDSTGQWLAWTPGSRPSG